MKICVIGMSHPCRNPRLVREVDALIDAGYDVRVIVPRVDENLTYDDNDLLAQRNWQIEFLDYRPSQHRYLSFYIRAKRKAMSILFTFLKVSYIAKRAYIPVLDEMTVLAAKKYADLYIAHTQKALPVAFVAAQKWSSKAAYDCEDLLAELESGDPPEIVTELEKQYLDKMAYITTPSKTIANQLKDNYAVTTPVVLYNVFPLSLAKRIAPPKTRLKSDTLMLHWFSVTIGAHRGIETIIEAMGYIQSNVGLWLRGNISTIYKTELIQLAKRFGVENGLHFLPTVEHDKLIDTLQNFDVGFASELPERQGYAKTVNNKLFSYLLAGIAVAATDTVGQQEVMQDIPLAGFTYPAKDSYKLAEKLQQWIDSPEALLTAKEEAWVAARNKYCWDIEREKFLRVVHKATHISL